MRRLLLILSMALVMISFGVDVLMSQSDVKTFTEDFSSDTYLDLENSTARWEPLRGDLRLPAYQIEKIGEAEIDGKAWSTVIQDFRLYVASGYSGVQVYDLSVNPENPFYLGYYDAPGDVHNLSVVGDSLYVACGQAGFEIINKALIFAPLNTGNSDDRRFVQSESAEPERDIMDYIGPGRSILGAPLLDSFTFDIKIARDSLAVIAQWDSVKILKVKSDNRRFIYDIIDGKVTPGGAYEVESRGDYIYLSENNFGMRILSFTDIDAVIGEYETPGKSYGFDIEGDYLYLAASESGLHILNISNPEAPSLVSTFDTDLEALDADGYAVDVTIAGDYAYVSEWGEAVVVVDISDPGSPVLAGYSEMEDILEGNAVNWPWGVVLSDTVVYAADYNGGVKILRASPSFTSSSYAARSKTITEGPDEISRVKMDTEQEGSISWRVSADGGANWQPIEPDGNWYDLNAPGNELMWGSTHYPAGGLNISSCSSLTIQYASPVATTLSGSRVVFDESVVRLEWSMTAMEDNSSFIISRSSYPEDNFRRLAVIDSGSELEYSYEDSDWESNSTYHYRVYAENEGNQILLFESGPVSVPASMLSLYQNEPNPFNPSTRIRYNLPEKARVVLNIYDVSGRLVKSLVEGVRDKGINSVVWNGKDDSGRAVNSGVYFYTLNSESGKITRKLVLLR